MNTIIRFNGNIELNLDVIIACWTIYISRHRPPINCINKPNFDSYIFFTTFVLQQAYNDMQITNKTISDIILINEAIKISNLPLINNKALNIDEYFGGLINDHYGKGDVINISYCVFIGNEIAFSAYGYNPIIVGLKTTFGEVSNVFPNVIFNYNFVNDNYDKFR